MSSSTGHRLIQAIASFFAVALFFALPAQGAETIRIGGVGTALGSMKLLASAFERSHRDVRVQVLSSLGSGGGIKAVSRGAIDIGVTGRRLTQDEQYPGLSVLQYAKTPFVLIARQDVKASGLTTSQIAKIFRSDITTWPGGGRIRLVVRPPSDADVSLAKSISPEMRAAVESALSRPGMLLALTDQDNANVIEKTPGAIGFSTLTQVKSEKRRVKILAFNGVRPSLGALEDGSYRLYKPLFVVVRKAMSRRVRDFLDFIGSSEGARILANSGNLVVSSGI